MQLRWCLVAVVLLAGCGEEVKRPDRLDAEACAREALLLSSEDADTYWVRQRFDFSIPGTGRARPCEVGDPDEPALLEEKSDVLRVVLSDPKFLAIEEKWSVCVKRAGYSWRYFIDPLSESSNVGTLIADYGALRSALENGEKAVDLQAAYEVSVKAAERWASTAIKADRVCRAPYLSQMDDLIKKARLVD